jgi:hypothetical protein
VFSCEADQHSPLIPIIFRPWPPLAIGMGGR